MAPSSDAAAMQRRGRAEVAVVQRAARAERLEPLPRQRQRLGVAVHADERAGGRAALQDRFGMAAEANRAVEIPAVRLHREPPHRFVEQDALVGDRHIRSRTPRARGRPRR